MLKNKVAVISGGASGLGAATAKYLVAQGLKVALLDLDLKRAQDFAKTIDAYAVAADVSDAEQVEEAIKNIVDHYQAIHFVINCAGIAPAKKILGRKGVMPLADFARGININLVGTFNVMRLAAAQITTQAPYNEDGERGVIINTASIAAYEGQIGQTAYSASKGGIVSMTLPAARELAEHGIRVMTIAPGIMDTPMMAGMSDEVRASLAAQVTFPHRLGLPEQYAELVATIIKNTYLNGSVIRLDGAIRMGAK